MDLIAERERDEKRWEAALHDKTLKDDGTVVHGGGQNRSHSYLERKKLEWARRGRH